MLKLSKLHGFSLIEVLIALSIFSVLLLWSASMVFEVEHMLKKEHESTQQQLHALQIIHFFSFYLKNNVKPCMNDKAVKYDNKANSITIVHHENITHFKVKDDRTIIITKPILKKKDKLWLGNCAQHELIAVAAVRKQRNRQLYVITLAAKMHFKKIKYVLKRSVLHFYLRKATATNLSGLYLSINGKRANELVPGIVKLAALVNTRSLYLKFSTIANQEEKKWQDIQLLYRQVLS